MTVFFTSDLHLGHRAVAYARRYGGWPEDKSLVTPEDVQWHDDMLAQRWDATVKTSDVVWVLGDLVASNKSLPAALDWIGARPGTKHFVLGNHDPAHPMHTESHKYQRAYLNAFESVQMAAKRRIRLPDGLSQLVLLSHFPYTGDGEGREDRASQWRLPNQGYTLLHGHVHSKERVTYGTVGRPNRDDEPWAIAKQIHVGLDAHNFTPVSLEEIAGLIAG